MRSIWLALAVLGAPLVARSAPSTAEPVFSATIAYTAPRGCPSAEEFKTLVVGRLGFDPFAADAGDHVLVSVQDGERGLEGRLEWRDQEGHWAGDRTFTARTTDCSELARAMGFALAVQINLLATERAPATSRDGDAQTDPPGQGLAASAAPPPAAAAPRAPADASPPATHDAQRASGPVFEFGAGGALAVGLAPGAAGLARLFAGAAWGPWILELGGEVSTKTLEHRADGAGYAQQLVLGSVAGCWNPEVFGACLLTKAGVFNVEGRDIDVPASPSGAAVQLGARVRLQQRLGRSLFVTERVEGLFNLTRWRVTLDQIPVWTAPLMAGTLGVDVGAVF